MAQDFVADYCHTCISLGGQWIHASAYDKCKTQSGYPVSGT